MAIRSRFFAPLLLVAVACSSDAPKKEEPKSPNEPSSPGPLVTETATGTMSPASALLGREVDVTLSLSSGEADPKASLDLGRGVTVSGLTFTGASSLKAHLRIDGDAAIGKHDVRLVGGERALLIAGAFEVSPTVDLKVEGNAKQGGIVRLTLTDKDDAPFDSEFQLDDLGEGFFVMESDAKPRSATFTVLIAPGAKTGKAQIVGGNKTGLAFYADAAAFEVAALTPDPLTTTMKGVSLPSALDTKVVKFALPAGGANGAIYSLTANVAKGSPLTSMEAIWYGPKGTFSAVFADLFTPNDPYGAVDPNGDPLPQEAPYSVVLTVPIAPGVAASDRFVQLLPLDGTGELELVPTSFTANVAINEGTAAHSTAASAIELGDAPLATAGGIVISGQLASDTDRDVYKLSAAKGDNFEISVQGAPEAEVWLTDTSLGAKDTDPLFAYASNYSYGAASGATVSPIATADLDAKKKIYLVVVPYSQGAQKTGIYTVAVRKL